jgi:hypothetical protein
MIVFVFKKQTKVKFTLLFGYGIPLLIIGLTSLIIYFAEDNVIFNVKIEDYHL